MTKNSLFRPEWWAFDAGGFFTTGWIRRGTFKDMEGEILQSRHGGQPIALLGMRYTTVIEIRCRREAAKGNHTPFAAFIRLEEGDQPRTRRGWREFLACCEQASEAENPPVVAAALFAGRQAQR